MINHITVDDGTRLVCRTDGNRNAPALVLVNSLGTDLSMWEPQIDVLQQHFYLLRYDTRGHGQSDAPTGAYTLERLGRDLLFLLKAHGVGRAHICGLSLGGLTAQWVASYFPEKVGRLVLANTAARIGTEEGWQARINAVQKEGIRSIREVVLRRLFSATFRLQHPDITERFGQVLEETSPQGYMSACAALREADLHSVIGKIQAPTLIIAGIHDESTPTIQAEALHSAIPQSEPVMLLDAAHLSNNEQPEAFTNLLLRFM